MENTTFELNGIIYTADATRKYCYATENGKKTRINKVEFGKAEAEYELAKDIAETEESNLTEEMKEIAKKMAETEENNRVVLEPAEFNEHGMVECGGCPYAKYCEHSGAFRRNPVEKGGLGLCPRLTLGRTEEPEIEKPVEDPAPKAKKSRTNKNAAFKTTIKLADDKIADVTLTEKQVDFIKHLPDTCFWEHGLDSCIWVDCLCDDIGGQFKDKPMTVGAMISTLCEKGLGTRAKDRVNGKKCTSFALTELGKLVAAELGLN